MNAQFGIDKLCHAIETRDSSVLKSLYADDAVLTIIDSENPPSRPRVLTGSSEIGAFLDDIYSRNMTHRVESCVADSSTLAFVQGCRYKDGTRVIASSVVELGLNGITKQTIVQAWDT